MKEIRPGADAANGVGPERKSIYCVDILDIPSIPGTTINQPPAIVTRPLFIVWCTWRPECMISYVRLHPFFTHNHKVFNDNIGTFWTASQLASNLAFTCRPALPASKLLAASCRWLSSGTARVQGRCRRAKTPWQYRDGSGPRPGSP